MAYGNTFPVNYQQSNFGYNPYQQYPQQYPQYQNTYQNTLPNPMNNKMNGQMIFVNNQKEAEDWVIGRGETIILWDKNHPLFYIKSVDERGLPMPLEIKSYQDYDGKNEEQLNDRQSVQNNPLDNYVSKDLFEKESEKIVSKISELDKMAGNLSQYVTNDSFDQTIKNMNDKIESMNQEIFDFMSSFNNEGVRK